MPVSMSSRTPRAARRASEAPPRRGRPSRRPEIFAAALRLFRERGFHATSINDIGAAAGVAGTAIYSHYATKQEVLAEAIRQGAARIQAGMAEAVADAERSPVAEAERGAVAEAERGAVADAERGAVAALEKLVRAYVRVVLENADMNVCYMLESRNLDPEVRQPLLRRERGLRDAWRQRLLAVRPELSADQAQTLVQMAIFSIVALCVHRNPIERSELVELASSFVLGALYSPVPPGHP